VDSTKSALIDPFGDAVLRFCFLYRGMVPFETLMFEADICAFKGEEANLK
jgi:hypothetical protein